LKLPAAGLSSRPCAALRRQTRDVMTIWNRLGLRLGEAGPQGASAYEPSGKREEDGQGRDPKRLFLVVGLGALSWVATYVGMLELIESNLGDLPFIHKIIIGFSVAMLMTMIIWLLDKMFSPTDVFTKACYIAGYLFLSIISVGFGFGFYWKVLESRGEASRSAESAITQVQTALFAASTRLEQLQSTLDALTTVSSEKALVERDSGKSCPNSGPGDGPRRKMREEDAGRFKFASDFVKGRIGTVKADMAGLDGDLQKIVKDDRSVIDAKTGNRNEFLRGVSRKLDLTVTGFNAFRSDPQLKQIRIDLADRAEKTTITGAKGVVISCPDGQLQMALRGVVRAIDQLPELTKPQIAAVEGSEATIEAFRRLTTTFFGLLTFKLPPSADELRELQRKAIQSVEGSGQAGAPGAVARPAFGEQAAGLAKRDYVPLAVAVFVDLCLLLVSIGRPVNQFMGLERSMREAQEGPVYPILARFHDSHADADAIRHFEVFRDVIFDLNGQYHVAVPLNIPRSADNYAELHREAHRLANLCYALEGKGILSRPMSFLPGLVVQRQLKRRGSKFVECYGTRRPARYRRSWDAVRSVWSDIPELEKPAFKVYRFKKGAWPEMILGAVMGASRGIEPRKAPRADDYSTGAAHLVRPNGHGSPIAMRLPEDAWNGVGRNGRYDEHEAFGRYQQRFSEPDPHTNGAQHHPTSNGHGHDEPTGGAVPRESQVAPEQNGAPEPQLVADEPLYADAPARAADGSPVLDSFQRALARLLPGSQDRRRDVDLPSAADPAIEPERIAGRFARSRNGA
jgi:hypothetical protein